MKIQSYLQRKTETMCVPMPHAHADKMHVPNDRSGNKRTRSRISWAVSPKAQIVMNEIPPRKHEKRTLVIITRRISIPNQTCLSHLGYGWSNPKWSRPSCTGPWPMAWTLRFFKTTPPNSLPCSTIFCCATSCEGIETTIKPRRLLWTGPFVCMLDDHLPDELWPRNAMAR